MKDSGPGDNNLKNLQEKIDAKRLSRNRLNSQKRRATYIQKQAGAKIPPLDSSLNNLKEKINSKRRDRYGLNLRERQVAYIQKRTIEVKEAKFLAIFLRVSSGLLMVGIIYFWNLLYNMSLVSGFGIVVGVITAGIFKIMYPGGINPNNKTQKYLILIFGSAISLLMFIHPNAFTVMLLASATAAFVLFGNMKSSFFITQKRFH